MTDPVTPEPTPAASVPPAAPVYAPAPAGPKQALSLTSFITGIASIVFFAVPVLGFLAGLAGLILGIIGKKREPAAPKWMATVGLITGIVGLVINIIWTIVIVILPLLFAASIATIPGTYGN